MFYFDPVYLLFMAPAMLLAFWAQYRVKHNFTKYSRVRSSSGVTGAQAALAMLRSAGLERTVGIERVQGTLSDHYDPRARVLRLSSDVHDSPSVAALGIACHEAGHAVQHAKHYAPLAIRNAVVPVAGIGSQLGIFLIIGGMALTAMGAVFGKALLLLGVLGYAMVLVFQIINLPVEFDASARAKKMLPQLGLIRGPEEMLGVNAVLNAAAMTYVAATVSALMQVLYWLVRLGVLGGNRRD